MVVDYRALNKLTIKNRYPLPKINDLFDQLVYSVHWVCLKDIIKLEFWKIMYLREHLGCHLIIINSIFLSFGLINCCTPLFEECLQHHKHKGDLGMTPKTCGAISDRAQVILVWVRAPGHWEHLPPTNTRNHKD